MLLTDYLVIGSGAASMAFVDTLLTEQPKVKVTIVDKHSAPGGHWNDAYGHVRLHQPSLLYGVASQQLEGRWLKLILRQMTLPWNHRASKTELLAHYKFLMDQWVASGRVSYYPNCAYDFGKKPSGTSASNIHTFVSVDGAKIYKVKVNVKLVNGIVGECKVPSKYAPKFSVGEGVSLMTPNQIYDLAQDFSKSVTVRRNGNYVVLGNGKTAMDAIVFLQRIMKVPADNISWVIPNDVWMLLRGGSGMPSSWPEALVEHDLDANKAALSLETSGAFVRLDKNVMPNKFRYALIGNDELAYMRKIKDVIRRGRVSCISASENKVTMNFTKGQPLNLLPGTTFVHCTSGGPFNSNNVTKLFPNEKEMNLWLLFAPPVPICMSILAALESRRRNGTLDLEFGRKLVAASTGSSDSATLTADEVLNELVQGLRLADDATGDLRGQVDTLTVTAGITALLDKNPLVAHKWLKSNRLSMLSIPGVKGNQYESICNMIKHRKSLNLSNDEAYMLKMLADKLKPLEGK